MANVKVSALSALTAPADADVLLIVDDSEAAVEKSKKVTAAALKAYNMVGGYLQRAAFSWKDADEIYVGAGCYDVAGKIALWSSQLTKQLSGPTASTWYYLYLDESAIASLTAVTATELIWSTTAPGWSHTYRGWYNGADRCIFAVYSNASSQITEFFHGGDLVQYADQLAGGKTSKSDHDFILFDVDDSWVDCYLPIPGCATHAKATIHVFRNGANAACTSSFRTNGQTGTTGHAIAICMDTVSQQYNSFDAISDASQIIEVINSASNSHVMSIYANGWYFPVGM